MRYKNIIFNGKTYTEQFKIDDILISEGFNWLLDAEIENASLEIFNKTLVWNNGLWYNGTWEYGVFRNGEWRYGVWKGGVWYNGTWKNGRFETGLIFDGTFINGIILGQEIRGGKFINVDISDQVKRTDLKEENTTQNIQLQGEKILEHILNFKHFTQMKN
jgi:hypothetical protein